MRKIMVFGLAFLTLALAACSTGSPPVSITEVHPTEISVSGGSYQEISVEELNFMLENKNFTLVNVHIPFEGDIPQTDLSIPFDEIDQQLDQLPVGKDSKIVLYCRSDRMSTIASETLVELGYTNIWNVDGGMAAWEQAGYGLEGLD